jgi:uncharacterized protein (TIGR00369 family)
MVSGIPAGVNHCEVKMLDEAARAALLETIRPIPIVATLGLRVDEFDEGYCKATVPRDVKYDGIFRSLHGGILMTIADSIACFAIMTITGPEQAMTTTDMNIRFLAPCLTDCVAVARVIKCGRTLCPTHVDLFDTNGTQVAVAQVTYMKLPRPPAHADA